MAERRMFAKSVVNSARFLKMPATARLLYYDLGMAADDDGIVEAYSVMKLTGASEDDLRMLFTKGFARLLNEDLVTLILDWTKNNQIRKERYKPGAYHHLLSQLPDGAQLSQLPDGVQQEEKHNAIDQAEFDQLRKERMRQVLGYK